MAFEETWDTISRLRSRLYRLLDEFGRPERAVSEWTPPADIYAREASVIITLEVPGVAREDLDVRVDGNVVTISGERKPGGEGEEVLRAERPAGRFRRSFALPWQLDADHVDARLERGVLTVTIPRSGARVIKVEAEGD